MSALDLAAFPLDVARRSTLRVATRSRLLTRLLARRDTRLALLATAQVVVAFALSLLAPVALFALAPVFLGAMHVASDVRYLVLRRRLPRVLLVVSALAASALVVLRVLSTLHVLRLQIQSWELVIGTAWIAAALLLASLNPGSGKRAAGVAFVFTALAIAGFTHARAAYLVFFHAHNLVAVLVWVVLFRRDRRWSLWPIAAIAIFTAVILSGAPLPWIAAHGSSAFGLRLSGLASWLAPGLPASLAASIVVAFVFLQGVHYAAWVGWVPQDSLPGEGTFTFRMTIRSLLADFGKTGLGIVVFSVVAVLVAAAFGLHDARNWYMTLSNFHGWLECALLAFFFVRGERAGAREAREA